jgi:hypothetical protein
MANVENGGERRILARGMADLDGDGRDELITVTGVTISEGGFSRDMVLLVRNGATGVTSSVRPPLNDGYPPHLTFVNLTGGTGKEILLTIPTGGSGGIVNAYVYRYLRGAPILLFGTETFEQEHTYEVAYRDGYRVEVASLSNGLNYMIDISQRGGAYLEQMYNPDGTLIQPTEGFVSPISGIYPVDFDGDGQSELLTFQLISGLFRADGLGYVQNILAWDGAAFALDSQYVSVFGFEPTAQAE